MLLVVSLQTLASLSATKLRAHHHDPSMHCVLQLFSVFSPAPFLFANKKLAPFVTYIKTTGEAVSIDFRKRTDKSN